MRTGPLRKLGQLANISLPTAGKINHPPPPLHLLRALGAGLLEENIEAQVLSSVDKSAAISTLCVRRAGHLSNDKLHGAIRRRLHAGVGPVLHVTESPSFQMVFVSATSVSCLAAETPEGIVNLMRAGREITSAPPNAPAI